MKDNNILIIIGGHINEEFLKKQIAKKVYSVIIVADCGLVSADRLGVIPDHIVGDFDSVSEKLLEKYRQTSIEINRFPREKDKTDTEIAIELALMHDPTNLDIFGATGSRLDHTVANLHLLMLPLQLGIDANLLDEHNKIYLKKEGFTINKARQHGSYISLMPFCAPVKGVVLEGFKYPLREVDLNMGSSLGISNEIVDEIARVEFSGGILLVIESLD